MQCRSIFCGMLLAGSALGAQPADTIYVPKEKLFGLRDLIVAGGFTAATIALYPADRRFAEQLQNPGAQGNRFIKDVAITVREIAVPGALIIGSSMYVVGRVAHVSRAADLGLHGTEAILVASQLGAAIKLLAGRARPYRDISDPKNFSFGRGRKSDDYRSFPSGHAVAAFAAASAVTSETTRWWPSTNLWIGTLMYGGASLVALSRMYENKHWASDVIVGAAIGTFTGQKVVQWHHSHPGNAVDRWLLHTSIAPGADGRMMLGVSAVW